MASSLIVQGKITANLAYTGLTKQIQPNASITVNITGKYAVDNTITVPTSDTTLDKGSIGTVGYFWIQNLDNTNYVEIGDGTNWLWRAIPGGPPVMGYSNDGNPPHVMSHTGACDLYYALFEA